MKTTVIYRRKLPHIQFINGDFLVTFRLKMRSPNHIDYTLNNPVKANLVKYWKEWPYS